MNKYDVTIYMGTRANIVGIAYPRSLLWVYEAHMCAMHCLALEAAGEL